MIYATLRISATSESQPIGETAPSTECRWRTTMSKTGSTQINLDSIGDSRDARGVVEEQPWEADWSNIQDRRQRNVDAVPQRVLRRRKRWVVVLSHDVSHERAAELLDKEGNGISVSDEAVMDR